MQTTAVQYPHRRIVDSKGGWMETPTVKHSSDDFNEKVISTVIFGWQKPLILFSNKAYHRFNSYHSRDNNKISSSRLVTVTANGFLRFFSPTSFYWHAVSGHFETLWPNQLSIHCMILAWPTLSAYIFDISACPISWAYWPTAGYMLGQSWEFPFWTFPPGTCCL